MTQNHLTDWDEDVTFSVDEEYDALVRAISWAQGFGLLFVQCSPSEGEQIIQRVREDVTEKTIEVLHLEAEIDDLHRLLSTQPNINTTDVLFITGLEKSLVDYIQAGYGSEGDYYAKDRIPKLLGKLNLQREVFKQDFQVCFVFLVPRYAMKYLIRRAADFFDWRSGVWEFIPSGQALTQEKQRILEDADYFQYLSWTAQQRQERCLEIDDLLDQSGISDQERLTFLFEQGNIFVASQNFQDAIASYDKALEFKPNYEQAWYNRGVALGQLGRFEDAIASYNKALEFKPNYEQAWNNRGVALGQLGRLEDAIASYDKALEFKPNDEQAWYNRGFALGQLGRFEDAIASYDKALEFKPNDDQAWNNRGIALRQLGRLEDAIASYDKALEFKPNLDQAWNNRGVALGQLGRLEDAIASYDRALELKQNLDQAWNNRGVALGQLGRLEDAIASYDKALEFKPNLDQAWSNRGVALGQLGRLEDAIASYDKSLEFKPNKDEAIYNKACCYSLLNKPQKALEHLQKAIALAPETYRSMAKTDLDFDSLKDDPRFQALLE